MTNPNLIQCENLCKTYKVADHRADRSFLKNWLSTETKEVHALKGVGFSVRPGEVVGYIGLNGSGKSTTMKLLSGIFPATRGSVKVFERDPFLHRKANVREIGAVFGQRTSLSWDLPAIDSMKLLKKMYGISEQAFSENLKHFSDILDLSDFFGRPVRQLSLGQKMRVELCSAFLHNPRLLLLDEPTLGLDFSAKERILSAVRKYCHERGAAAVLTSHDLGDIERYCDRVLLLNRGELIFDGLTSSLLEKHDCGVRMDVEFASPLRVRAEEFPGAEINARSPAQYRIRVPVRTDLPMILGKLSSKGSLVSIKFQEISLEEIIGKLALSGKGGV